MPSARAGAAPELLLAAAPPAWGVLLRADDDAWPFSNASLPLPPALASVIAACTCMRMHHSYDADPAPITSSRYKQDVVSYSPFHGLGALHLSGGSHNRRTDLFHGVPQHLLDLGSNSRHCSRLQLPELSRIGCRVSVMGIAYNVPARAHCR